MFYMCSIFISVYGTSLVTEVWDSIKVVSLKFEFVVLGMRQVDLLISP